MKGRSGIESELRGVLPLTEGGTENTGDWFVVCCGLVGMGEGGLLVGDFGETDNLLGVVGLPNSLSKNIIYIYSL